MILPSLTLSVIKLLLLGTFIWLLFRMLKKGAELLLSEKPYKRAIDTTLFYIKTASWIIFIFWSADIIFNGQPLMSRAFAALLFCILIAISWSLIRDIVSGILIRTEGTFAKNSHVRIHGVEGLVKKLGYRAMEIETDRGETIRIPYSIVDKEITIRSFPIESIKSHTFELLVDKSKDFLDYKEQIRNTQSGFPSASSINSPRLEPSVSIKLNLVLIYY